ncbi:MAG: hypothetical protein IIV47_04165 [Clostridia bacterium]|nr:hypothetical protein [Clostridia bacterium]
MSNGLYNGNNELPQMTRSGYVKEYTEITTYFDEEKARIKKTFPFFLAIAVVYIVYLILSDSGFVPEIPLYPLLYAENKKAFILLCFWFKYIPLLPLGSLIIRKRQIRKKENQRLADLENRKKLCMDIGTYDVEK